MVFMTYKYLLLDLGQKQRLNRPPQSLGHQQETILFGCVYRRVKYAKYFIANVCGCV